MNGKVVIITGGNRGIGAEVVKCFVKAGASVCSSYYPSEEMENSNIKLLKEIKKYNGKILTIPCDLSNPKDIEILVRKTQNKFGKISNIISNAAHSGNNIDVRIHPTPFIFEVINNAKAKPKKNSKNTDIKTNVRVIPILEINAEFENNLS